MGTVKYTGPVASFHCPTNAEIRSLKVHFSPKQEGSGDPSPENVREIVGWDGVIAGQCGKNCIDESFLSDANNYTISGSYGYVYTDYLYLAPNTKYRFVWFNTNDITMGSANLYCTGAGEYIVNSGLYRQYPNGFTTDETGKIRFGIHKSSTYSTIQEALDVIFNNGKLLLQVGIEDIPYEPYQGSTTNYEFGVLGKNKFDSSSIVIIDHKAKDANGIEIDSTSNKYNSNYIPVAPSTIYTISGLKGDGTNIGYQRLYFYTKEQQWITRSDYFLGSSFSFTTPSNCFYLQIQGCKNETYTDIQIELGSTATTYEPYDPNHTVYGGWVDLISGEVCEEYGFLTEDSGGTLASVVDRNDGYYSIIFNFDTNKRPYSGSGSLCNILKYNSTLTAQNNEYAFYYYLNQQAWKTECRIYSATPLTTVDEAKTYLNQLGFKLAYKIPAPNTYHLAPTQLQTFLGQNNVWSNADYVEIEYDLHETQSILARKQFIVANQPHIVKPAAAPLQNFVTDVAAPLKECKVHFNPQQDLHGYSNPWPAGGGKNIAKPYDNSYVSSTYISFDYSAANGTFRCYGTASASSTHSSPSATNAVNNGATFTLPAGTYTLSIIDGDGASIYAQCVSSAEIVLAETTSYTTFTTNESLTVFVRLKVAAGATVDNTVKIQLEAGSTATSYTPYENVCPISGWTELTAYRGEENLIPANLNWTSKKMKTSGGTITGSVYNCFWFPVPKGTIYFHKRNSSGGIAYMAFINKEPEIGDVVYGNVTLSSYTNYTFDNSQGHPYAIICGPTGTRTETASEYCSQNEICVTAAHFNSLEKYPEPYTGTTLPIDWTTEAGTVYGGYVDLVTGEVWNTYQQVILDGDETLNVGTSAYNGTDGTNRYVTVPNHGCGTSTAAGCCDKAKLYKENIWGYPNTHRWGFTLNANTQLHIAFDNATVGITAETEDRTAAIKTWLTNNPMTFYIPRKNPELVGTLTPTQLKTLRGTNNIWASNNGENIEVAFWRH